jgi:hypothetical protein
VARSRWFGRTDRPGPGGDRLDVAELRMQHLLLVPSTIGVEEVTELLRSRVPHADLLRDGLVSLGRHSRFTGPYELSMEEAVDAAVPMPWTLVYALQAPIEREDPPLPGVEDRDGFAHAFPYGLPWREEGRGLHLLVALARRLHGAVRIAAAADLVTPDPGRAVDHLVHSPYWLDPDVLVGLVGRILPGARLALQAGHWTGPPAQAYTGELYLDDIAHDPLHADELWELHSAADDVDVAVMQQEEVLDAYAVHAPVGAAAGRHSAGSADGAVEVRVHLGEPGEPATADQPWAQDPYVTYEVRWLPLDPASRERRHPDEAHLATRERVKPAVAAVARAVVEAAGGVVTDEDGFWVDRYSL